MAELPGEMAELALLPAVPPRRPRGRGSRVAAEQPVAPDRRRVRACIGIERDRREDTGVEVDHGEPVRELEQLQLEDPLPPERGQQLENALGEAVRRSDGLR